MVSQLWRQDFILSDLKWLRISGRYSIQAATASAQRNDLETRIFSSASAGYLASWIGAQWSHYHRRTERSGRSEQAGEESRLRGRNGGERKGATCASRTSAPSAKERSRLLGRRFEETVQGNGFVQQSESGQTAITAYSDRRDDSATPLVKS